MAWSWSHTNEAYAAAYNNVHKQDREWLEVCYAEWHATEMHDEESAMAGTLDINSFNEDKYNEALAACKNLPNDILADYIWESFIIFNCHFGSLPFWQMKNLFLFDKKD